jgi:hypothetical protein
MKTRTEIKAEMKLMGIELSEPIPWPKGPHEKMMISLPLYKAQVLGLGINDMLTIRYHDGKYCIEKERISLCSQEVTP